MFRGGGTIKKENKPGGARVTVGIFGMNNSGTIVLSGAMIINSPSVANESGLPSKSKSVKGVKANSKQNPIHNRNNPFRNCRLTDRSFILDMPHALLE